VSTVHKMNRIALVLSLWVSSFAIAATPGRSSPVVVVDVTEHTLEQEISLSGTVEALQQSRLSSRVAGVVDEVYVTEGSWVEAGQKLFMLNSAIARVEVATAKELVAEASALHNDAQRRVAENRSLADSNHVAATALATAVAEAEAASATLARRRSELQRLQVLLDRHTLTAPFAGIIAEKNVAVGQWITADAPALQLVALDDLRIRAAVPQQYVAQLGQDARARERRRVAGRDLCRYGHGVGLCRQCPDAQLSGIDRYGQPSASPRTGHVGAGVCGLAGPAVRCVGGAPRRLGVAR
jgi:multidrug efflux pump subunit AcrA (membrane-fusion protein)